jgi:hypothetical protein
MGKLADASPGLAVRIEEIIGFYDLTDTVRSEDELKLELDRIFNPLNHPQAQGVADFFSDKTRVTELWDKMVKKNPELVVRKDDIIIDLGTPNERVASSKREQKEALKQENMRRIQQEFEDRKAEVTIPSIYTIKEDSEGGISITGKQRAPQLKTPEQMDWVAKMQSRQERFKRDYGLTFAKANKEYHKFKKIRTAFEKIPKEERTKDQLEILLRATQKEEEYKKKAYEGPLNINYRYKEYLFDNPGEKLTLSAYRAFERRVKRDRTNRALKKKSEKRSEYITKKKLKEYGREMPAVPKKRLLTKEVPRYPSSDRKGAVERRLLTYELGFQASRPEKDMTEYNVEARGDTFGFNRFTNRATFGRAQRLSTRQDTKKPTVARAEVGRGGSGFGFGFKSTGDWRQINTGWEE